MELTGNFLPLLSIDYTNFVLSLHSLMANKRLRSDDANSNGDHRIHYVTTFTSSMNLNDVNTLQWKQASAMDNMVTIMGSTHWQTMSWNFIWTSRKWSKRIPEIGSRFRGQLSGWCKALQDPIATWGPRVPKMFLQNLCMQNVEK